MYIYEMTVDERYKYLQIKQKQYVLSSRKEQSKMLVEMQSVTQLARKTLIRHMRGKIAGLAADKGATHTVQPWTMPCA